MNYKETEEFVERIFTLANNQYITKEERFSKLRKEIIQLSFKQRALGRTQAINVIYYSIEQLKEKKNI